MKDEETAERAHKQRRSCWRPPFARAAGYKPHVAVDEGPTAVKPLVVRQQKLHVGLQQEADLLLHSPLALLLFLLVLLLLTEDGVQILRYGQAHH